MTLCCQLMHTYWAFIPVCPLLPRECRLMITDETKLGIRYHVNPIIVILLVGRKPRRGMHVIREVASARDPTHLLRPVTCLTKWHQYIARTKDGHKMVHLDPSWPGFGPILSYHSTPLKNEELEARTPVFKSMHRAEAGAQLFRKWSSHLSKTSIFAWSLKRSNWGFKK